MKISSTYVVFCDFPSNLANSWAINRFRASSKLRVPPSQPTRRSSQTAFKFQIKQRQIQEFCRREIPGHLPETVGSSQLSTALKGDLGFHELINCRRFNTLSICVGVRDNWLNIGIYKICVLGFILIHIWCLHDDSNISHLQWIEAYRSGKARSRVCAKIWCLCGIEKWEGEFMFSFGIRWE